MTENAKIWVRRIYYALITVALVTVAVLLMVQCVAIYRLGDDAFTRVNIARHFAPIAIPVYVCIGMAVAGFALSPLLPAAPDSAPDRDAVTLRRLQAKTDLSACDSDMARKVNILRRTRNTHHKGTLAMLTTGTVVFLWYALDVERFYVETKDADVRRAVLVLLVCMLPAFLYGLFTAYFCRQSVKKEIALLRTAPKEAIAAAPKAATTEETWIPYLQGALIVIGVGMLVYGALIGGAGEVLKKAAVICTECIGLG